jgi:hypothetical protein
MYELSGCSPWLVSRRVSGDGDEPSPSAIWSNEPPVTDMAHALLSQLSEMMLALRNRSPPYSSPPSNVAA